MKEKLIQTCYIFAIVIYFIFILLSHSYDDLNEMSEGKFIFFLRLLGNILVMIHVRKSMQRFTTTGQMFRKHSMPTKLAFLISGLLAGELELFFLKLKLNFKIKL